MKKEVAGFPRRIIAYIIDIFILKSLVLRPFAPFLKNLQTDVFSLNFLSKELIIVSLSISILSLLYFTLLEFTVRQTIGKMITRIYVVSTTRKFDLKQIFVRNITKIVSMVLFLDVIYALIKKSHQRYFEILSNTEVLKVKK